MKTRRGKVESYDPVTAWGKIHLRGKKRLPFHASCFWPSGVRAAPAAGENVVVIFNGPESILEVRRARWA